MRGKSITLGMDTKSTPQGKKFNQHCKAKNILHYHKCLRDAQKVFVNQISNFFTESKKQTEVGRLKHVWDNW